MKIIFKARKSAFTLVELLMAAVIISILAGMMMMTMGSAADSAEASKIIYDLRILKSASLIYFYDYGDWPSVTHGSAITGAVLRSLEACMDKPFSVNYSAGSVFVAISNDRILYGLSPDKMRVGTLKKLQKYGGLYDDNGNMYVGTGKIYTIVK
jgi:prepilin-type N-terminal cleavage/methylation domain-containing protein